MIIHLQPLERGEGFPPPSASKLKSGKTEPFELVLALNHNKKLFYETHPFAIELKHSKMDLKCTKYCL
jgi:hypothetical protein